MSNRRHPARTPLRCSDCTARGWLLRHDDTCPLALAGDARRELDRAYMASRGIHEYSRPVSWPEIASARIAGDVISPDSTVTVRTITPGIAVRLITGPQR